MFIYFKSGILKEVINNDAYIQGNVGINNFYVYAEDINPTNCDFTFSNDSNVKIGNTVISQTFATIQFVRDASLADSTHIYIGDVELKYFKEYVDYRFCVLTSENIPSTILGEPNVYKLAVGVNFNGMSMATGLVTFNVLRSNIQPDETMVKSDFQYLLNYIGNVAIQEFKTINGNNIKGSGDIKVGTVDYVSVGEFVESTIYDNYGNVVSATDDLGNTITIAGYDDGSPISFVQLKTIGGNSIYPRVKQQDIIDAQLIKNASVSGNTLTLTKQDNTTVVYEGGTTYTAGSNVSIINNVINATDTKYQAGNGLGLAGTTFSVDTSVVQPKLTAGNNVSISGLNVISATDTTYSAGSNISISDGVISATDTTYAQGNGITISSGTISANVDNNLTSTSTTNALSAYQGKLLNDRIDNLLSVGKFLSIWNASNGSVLSEPPVSTYTYKVGDYYRVGTSGTKNPAPNLSYVVGGTNYVEGSALSVGDVIYCSTISGDTTTWVVLSSGGAGSGTVQDVTLNGVSTLSGSVAVLSDVERSTNKVTSLGAGSTDTQYPSAKLVYDQLATKQASLSSTQLNAVNSGITSGKVSTYDGYASSKQDLLVSGTNIKTINSTSILGSGNITVGVEMEIFESGD